jgi:hypothetical protein
MLLRRDTLSQTPCIKEVRSVDTFSWISFWRLDMGMRDNNNNNNNYYYYLLQMGCHQVAVITLHVFPNTDNKFT